jgi:hypothetical protein
MATFSSKWRFLLVVAALGLGAAAETKAHPRQSRPPGCERVVDASIPEGTKFPYTVPHEIGSSSLKLGDRILIREVRGTRPRFEVGGIYKVIGEYTLASAAEARLALSVTAVRRGDGCTFGNGRGTRRVVRGSGTFDLAAVMPYAGHPHLTFYVVGRNSGGIYFGKPESPKKR